jgi:HD superfamily phosphodiesterase
VTAYNNGVELDTRPGYCSKDEKYKEINREYKKETEETKIQERNEQLKKEYYSFPLHHIVKSFK